MLLLGVGVRTQVTVGVETRDALEMNLYDSEAVAVPVAVAVAVSEVPAAGRSSCSSRAAASSRQGAPRRAPEGGRMEELG